MRELCALPTPCRCCNDWQTVVLSLTYKLKPIYFRGFIYMVPRRYSSFEDFHKRHKPHIIIRTLNPEHNARANSLKAESYGPLPALPPKQQLGRFAPGRLNTTNLQCFVPKTTQPTPFPLVQALSWLEKRLSTSDPPLLSGCSRFCFRVLGCSARWASAALLARCIYCFWVCFCCASDVICHPAPFPPPFCSYLQKLVLVPGMYVSALCMMRATIAAVAISTSSAICATAAA